MDEGFELRAAPCIGEDDRAELGTIDSPSGVEDVAAEFADDVFVGGLAGLDESMSKLIGVENVAAESLHHGRDGAFAAADAPGQSNPKHLGELARGRGAGIASAAQARGADG